jgi:phytoene/squalene synthetase
LGTSTQRLVRQQSSEASCILGATQGKLIYYGEASNHPLRTNNFLQVLQRKKLSKHFFKRIIKARTNFLNTSTFDTLQSIENYAENSVSSIYYLLLEAHGIKDINTDHFASHLGKAHGIVTLVRSVPHNAQKRSLTLPQDVLMKYKVSSESVLQGRNSEKLKDVIFEISTSAKQHLNKVGTHKVVLSFASSSLINYKIIFIAGTIPAKQN